MNVFAVVTTDSMNIYAVTTDGEGLVAKLTVNLEPGTGKIWSAVTPLVGTSTQNAERIAVKVAETFSNDSKKYDYKFTISSNASIVEGPSAGAAMALLVSSMLLDKNIPDNVSITGTINEDGSVGAVGGIFEKTREASNTGIKLFLIPKGEAMQTVKLDEGVRSVNLVEYAPQEWGITVVEVNKIEDAIAMAFSDISEIDINHSTEESIPDFIPDKTQLPAHLGSFKILTTNYIKETKQIVNEARNALEASLLEDPAAVNFLLQTLTSADQTLSKAEILNEQNYLYSAANYSFLARVNAVSVKEISINPELLENNSTVLDLKLLELDKELQEYEDSLREEVPREGIEWFISAQQRYLYAKNTVNRLISNQTIIVGGTKEDELTNTLERIQDYAFAATWLDVSKDFYNISKESDAFVKRTADFEILAGEGINNAENALSEIDSEERDDIVRRIDSAISAREIAWYESALIDSVSAEALIDSETIIEGKTNEEMREILENKIQEVEKKIDESEFEIGWPKLYITHAKFFLEAADYYEKLEFSVSAANNLESGIGLALLAEKVFDSTEEIKQVYSQLEPEPETPIIIGPINTGNNGTPSLFITAVAFLLLVTLILSLLTLLIGMLKDDKRLRHRTVFKEIKALEKSIERLDDKFLKGKIDAETHTIMKNKIQNEIDFLQEERKDMISHVLAADDYSSEIQSYTERILDLKKHFKENIISAEEYESKSREYLEKTKEIKAHLENELREVARKKNTLATNDVEALISKRKKMLPAIVGTENLVVTKKETKIIGKIKPIKTTTPAATTIKSTTATNPSTTTTATTTTTSAKESKVKKVKTAKKEPKKAVKTTPKPKKGTKRPLLKQ